ncbi:hypothetical protein NMY22_g277 [Coprinellus aureogranulatus]|nr:hypothetical protein NMY22_g277 [Coprinellus aureogranulatus]
MATPAPRCTRPPPTDVQKSKPSPYHHESFPINTLLDVENSDLDSDEDVSALEMILQDGQRQLDFAHEVVRRT